MAERAMMETSGVQAYMSYLPTSLVLCLALALPLAAGAAVGKRWRGASITSLWLFGLVPVLGFVGHALAEPLFQGDGGVSRLYDLTPVVLVGLLIQIPFALVAVGLAHRVLWLAESLARALTRPRSTAGRREPESFGRPRALNTRAFSLDLSHGQRAPPSLRLA